jgi:ribosome-binding protein aMBF1 (putative translation factor)
MKRKKTTRDALVIIDRLFFDGNTDRKAELEQELLNARVAHEVYKLRVRAGLTQRRLAERVGTTASVISRLEDNDYGGHSLRMLQRIAFVLGQRVEVRFRPLAGSGSSKAASRQPKTR